MLRKTILVLLLANLGNLYYLATIFLRQDHVLPKLLATSWCVAGRVYLVDTVLNTEDGCQGLQVHQSQPTLRVGSNHFSALVGAALSNFMQKHLQRLTCGVILPSSLVIGIRRRSPWGWPGFCRMPLRSIRSWQKGMQEGKVCGLPSTEFLLLGVDYFEMAGLEMGA